MRQLAAVALIVAGTRGTATAQDADAMHRAGEAAYKAREFRAAATAFESARTANPRPATIFSLAQSYRQLYVTDHQPADLLRAVELYREYLAAAPRGPRSEDARELLSNLEPLAELVRSREPALQATQADPGTRLLLWSAAEGATVQVDDEAPQPMPLLVEVTPGAHRATITAPHHDEVKLEATAVAGQLVPVEARLEPHPATVTIGAPSGSQVVLDDVPRGSATVLSAPPGQHRLWVGARGTLGVERTFVVRPGDAQTLTFDLPPSPRLPVTRAVLVGGLTLLALGTGSLVYAGVQHHEASDLLAVQRERPWTASELDDYTHHRDSYGTWSSAGIVAVSAGVIGIAVAALLHYTDVPTPR